MNKWRRLVLVALITLSIPALPIVVLLVLNMANALTNAASSCDINEIPGSYRLVTKGIDQRLRFAKDRKGFYLVDGVSIPFDWEYLSDCYNLRMDFDEENGFNASLAWEAIPYTTRGIHYRTRKGMGLHTGVAASCLRSPKKLFVHVDSNIYFEEY